MTDTQIGEADRAGGGGVIPIRLVDSDGLEAALDRLSPAEAAWARSNGFAGRLGQSVAIPEPDGGIARVLVGWGTAERRRRQRFVLAGYAGGAPGGTYRLETELAPDEAEREALGWLLARYRFDRYKRASDGEEADLLAPAGVPADRLGILAEGAYLARDLVNTPARDLGPAELEAAVRKVAEGHGASVRATQGNALLEANLPLIHAVGRASASAPRLIDMVWGREDAPKVTLVGKGVCFDTGGLNLKTAAGMGLMKKDMGGAASVLGLAHMVMSLGLDVRLRVLIPAVENAVSGSSFHPGDVLPSRKGLTVEVNNTDAEGRLVLADALALGAEEHPDLMFDMATLTGAARVALGPDLPAMYTDDDTLAGDLAAAGAATADPVWRLPLWPGYEADIEPGIADLDNAPSGGMAGSITAALFLKRFAGDGPWVHFDIYAWNRTASPGRPKGGECQAARACLRVLEDRYGR